MPHPPELAPVDRRPTQRDLFGLTAPSEGQGYWLELRAHLPRTLVRVLRVYRVEAGTVVEYRAAGQRKRAWLEEWHARHPERAP